MKGTTRLQILRPVLVVLTLAGATAGCDVQSFDDAAAAFGGTNPPPPPGSGFNAVFSAIQGNVFTPNCATANCHSGANPPASLNLEAASSYAMLVGIASVGDSGFQRVNPGNPALSYLIQKLEGTASNSGQMPPAGALDQSVIDTIRQWISDGALDDTAVVTTPIRVSSLSPAPGASLSTAPTQIVAGFDADLDTSTVNALTYILEASTDGVFDNGDDMQINALSISVPLGNPRSAVFDLNGAMLADDTYRIQLLGSGANVIMDTNANALDGELIAGLPSGNGTAGGDFSSQFTLMAPAALTFDEIQANVFTPSCSGCHAGANPPGGLDLSNANASFAGLVNVASVGNPMIDRVEPNNANNSYLIMRMEATVPPVMPPSGMLNQAVINDIRTWIQNGAVR